MMQSRRSALSWLLAPIASGRGRASLVFSCPEDNDLYRTIASNMRPPLRCATAREAIRRAAPGSGVLILARNYPQAPEPFDEKLLGDARAKRLRMYAEYTAANHAQAFDPFIAHKERAVVTTSFFGGQLSEMSLLSLHSCSVAPLARPRADLRVHLALAKVAGFDRAVYGLPSQDVEPLLVESQSEPLLLAATQLSRMITARYGPTEGWEHVWNSILRWLIRGDDDVSIHWTPTVRPSRSASEALPADAEKAAALGGARWYFNARLFIHPSWAEKLAAAKAYEDRVGPAPTQAMPIGDGSLGLLEGHSSLIQLDGSQPARWWIRADCVGEASMVLALAAKLGGQQDYVRVARNLCEFLIARSKMANGTRLDPQNAAYGLIGWNEADQYYKNEDGYDVYYGDDNARCLLGLLAAGALTGETRWNRRIWLAILANFRLLGRMGYQKARYDQAPLAKEGWQQQHESALVLHDMNYQAYPWALFLWAFAQTGYQPFLDRCERGLRRTVEAYPQWRWSNSITSQLARLLLPLAWLVRVKDTSETRAWMRKISEELLSHQDASGAIPERTGPAGTGIQVPPASNEKYGAGEGALIQRNGDPAADMLYTMNFAFIGLHEAHLATGDAYYKEASDRIAAFLVRVQVRSTVHPQFDGAWYRAFDFQRWDYWASNSDSGWGAWCTEAGWSQSWISTTLSLRVLNESLWNVLQAAPKFDGFEELRKTMLPD